MKTKKTLAILGAAMCSCCAMGGGAFAEETKPVDYSQYQLGDITMDGIVDVDDAQLALQCYADTLAVLPFKNIPYEQQLLGCVRGFTTTATRVYPEEERTEVVTTVINVIDAQSILMYYVDDLAQKTDQSFEGWVSADEHFQEILADEYANAKPVDTPTPYYSYSVVQGNVVRTLQYYYTCSVQKVRE
ncbi:MAG: hypothetical protein IJ060_04245 [Oscillospiraceae bacterium]|nr:hypothetical protein [Oscillospiraceae bacterium]